MGGGGDGDGLEEEEVGATMEEEEEEVLMGFNIKNIKFNMITHSACVSFNEKICYISGIQNIRGKNGISNLKAQLLNQSNVVYKIARGQCRLNMQQTYKDQQRSNDRKWQLVF